VPTYSSWLNLVERFFALITRRAIRRGSFRSVSELIQRIDHFVANHNTDCKPFIWTATADSMLVKLQRLTTRISGPAPQQILRPSGGHYMLGGLRPKYGQRDISKPVECAIEIATTNVIAGPNYARRIPQESLYRGLCRLQHNFCWMDTGQLRKRYNIDSKSVAETFRRHHGFWSVRVAHRLDQFINTSAHKVPTNTSCSGISPSRWS
jgi:hypothetical protein